MRKLLFALALLLAGAHMAAASDVLVLTDIHFNPLADKALAEPLAAAPAEQWPAILDRGNERMSNYTEDSDWKLLRTTLGALQAQKRPDVVLIAGDFLAHGFRDAFNRSVAAHDDVAYRRFVVKTMRFLALELANTLPKTPILPALGNNDSDCGDYGLRPGGAYLADTEAIVAGMIGPSLSHGRRARLARSWTALGSYAVDDPAQPGFRVIGAQRQLFLDALPQFLRRRRRRQSGARDARLAEPRARRCGGGAAQGDSPLSHPAGHRCFRDRAP